MLALYRLFMYKAEKYIKTQLKREIDVEDITEYENRHGWPQ